MSALFLKVAKAILDQIDIDPPSVSRVLPGNQLKLALNLGQDEINFLNGDVLPFSLDVSSPLRLTELLFSPLPRLDLDLGSLKLTDVTTSMGEADLTIPEVHLDLSRSSPGQAGEVEFEVVSQDVEFPPPVNVRAADLDTGEAVTNALPYLVPRSVDSTGTIPVFGLNQNVKGVIAKAKGAVKGLQRVSGSVTGSLVQKVAGVISGTLQHQAKGALSLTAVPDTVSAKTSTITGELKRNVLPGNPLVRVKWEVLDENGNDLLGDPARCAVNGPVQGLLSDAVPPLPLLAFLPEFVDYQSGGAEAVSELRIWCTVSVEPPPPLQVKPRTAKLGPVTIQVPKVSLPSVLVMTPAPVLRGPDNVPLDPYRVLVAVPKSSTLDSPESILELLLAEPLGLQAVTRNLASFLRTPGFVLPDPLRVHLGYLDRVLEAIDRVIELLNVDVHRGRIAFVREDKVADLFNVGYWVFEFLRATWFFFEDIMGSLILVGPPGRGVGCYVAKGAGEVERLGAFRVLLHVVPCAIIPTLDTGGNPTVPPALAGPTDAEVVVDWQPERSPTRSFHNSLSSYRFI